MSEYSASEKHSPFFLMIFFFQKHSLTACSVPCCSQERDQYMLQKEQARQEYVASPRYEPQGPAGMVFKGSTPRTAADEEHARYKEELDRQVGSFAFFGPSDGDDSFSIA